MGKIFCRNCNKPILPPKRKYCDEWCGNELREKHFGEYVKYRRDSCQLCGVGNILHRFIVKCSLLVHHIDEDTRNNKGSNLITVCKCCHSFLHSNKFKKRPEDEKQYLISRKINFKEFNKLNK